MRQRVFFGYDPNQSDAALGYIHGIEKVVSTNKYVNRAAGYTHDVLKHEFETALDRYAKLNPSAFKHVYEWGPSYASRYALVGFKRARLWHLVSSQSGGSKSLSFVFLPSKVPVPVNPILLKPGGKKGRTVKEGVHIFVWKAQVMEYNLPVTIEPKLTEQLAYVGSSGKAMFSPKGYTFNPGSANNTAGNFTNFFLGWWSIEADRIFESKIRKRLEKDIASDKNFAKAMRKFKTKDKTISIGASRPGGSFRQASQIADADMRKNQETYIQEAAQRRWDLYGEED